MLNVRLRLYRINQMNGVLDEDYYRLILILIVKMVVLKVASVVLRS